MPRFECFRELKFAFMMSKSFFYGCKNERKNNNNYFRSLNFDHMIEDTAVVCIKRNADVENCAVHKV